MILGIALLLLASRTQADDGAPSLADYPEYRAALSDESRDPASAVTFRDLWNEPDRYRGRRVEIAGRIERRFRQPSVGEFPALAEVWVLDADGNPSCLVFPARDDGEGRPGGRVRFSGTFLRLIRYRAGESDRLAPLIVGPSPPMPTGSEEPQRGPATPAGWDWAVGLGLLALVVVVLGAQHLRGRPRRRIDLGPAPSFLGPNDEPPPVEGRAGGGADVP